MKLTYPYRLTAVFLSVLLSLAAYVSKLSDSSPSLQVQADAVSCRVVKIADGDTFTCLSPQNRQIKVRLHGIDAPEKAQAFGQKAKRHLSDLVYGKTVTLRIADTDHYGRTVADVFLPKQDIVSGSLHINRQMVKDGYAWAYHQYGGSAYAAAEAAAQSQRLGLWQEENPVSPAAFRRSGKQSP